ncbi:MAG: hypothetical protein CL609_17845 [Anaerolineaceae bacterium]|nr:hypothetical protein [Anaerolineaceae bacterium]
MQKKTGFIGYDWFKLIVAIILLLLLLWFLFFNTPTKNQTTENHTVNIPVVVGQEAAETLESTSAPIAEPTATAQPTQGPTEVPTAEPTLVPTPTVEPTTEPTVEPTAEPTAQSEETISSDCALAAPTRIKIGDKVRVTSNLHMRSSPDLGNNILQTNLAGSNLEIIGGPECYPYQNGAYLWWQVQLDSGTSGWSAEAAINSTFYFLEPIP